jgi:hypothetical protein
MTSRETFPSCQLLGTASHVSSSSRPAAPFSSNSQTCLMVIEVHRKHRLCSSFIHAGYSDHIQVSWQRQQRQLFSPLGVPNLRGRRIGSLQLKGALRCNLSAVLLVPVVMGVLSSCLGSEFGTQELYCSSGTSDTGNQSPSTKRCSGSISFRQNKAVKKTHSAKVTLPIATGTVLKSPIYNVLPIWRANDRTKSFVGGGGRIFSKAFLHSHVML